VQRRFHFRLSRVRRVRELEERQARAAWGAAQSAAAEAAEARETLSARLRAARRDHVEGLASGGSRPGTLLVEQRTLDRQVLELGAASELARTRADQAAALAEAWRERERARRALEELERRARDRFRTELRARETAEMDEIAGMRDAQARRQAARERRETDSSSTAGRADQKDRSPVPRDEGQ
jgi:flagellar export protein FliJ